MSTGPIARTTGAIGVPDVADATMTSATVPITAGVALEEDAAISRLTPAAARLTRCGVGHFWSHERGIPFREGSAVDESAHKAENEQTGHHGDEVRVVQCLDEPCP